MQMTVRKTARLGTREAYTSEIGKMFLEYRGINPKLCENSGNREKREFVVNCRVRVSIVPPSPFGRLLLTKKVRQAGTTRQAGEHRRSVNQVGRAPIKKGRRSLLSVEVINHTMASWMQLSG